MAQTETLGGVLPSYLPETSRRKQPPSVGRVVAVAGQSLSLDTINAAATYFSAKWEPSLKRSQSRDVLTAIISKLYGISHGHIFNAHARASHKALADGLGLSREWVCKLIGRLREAGWLRTEAPRLPDGKQEVTIFRPGRMLKRLLVMLLKSKQRQHSSNRVNETSQKLPHSIDQIEKSKKFLADLREELSQRFNFSKK